MYVGAFGPVTWDVMLLCALAYPKDPSLDEQAHMLNFITSIAHVLPCHGCSTHAVDYITNNPPDISSSCSVVSYIVQFHNTVNASTGKRRYTVEEATQLVRTKYLSDHVDMGRAQALRVEDHAKIIELQTKLDSQKHHSDLHFIHIINTVLLIVLIFILILIVMSRSK